MNNFENSIRNSILRRERFYNLRDKIRKRLCSLKKTASSNEAVVITSKNVLTLLSLQISIHKENYAELDFHVKLKTFLLFFSRYINKREIMNRFSDFDEKIDITKLKKTKHFLNRFAIFLENSII